MFPVRSFAILRCMQGRDEGPRPREGFVVLRGTDGRRHAVRPSYVAGVSDAEEGSDAVCVTLRSGAVVLAEGPLEDLVALLSGV